MFKNTIATFDGIITDVRRFLCFITVASQLITIGFFTYSSIMDNGFLPVNIAAIAVAATYLVIYAVAYGKKGTAKAVRVIANKFTRVSKLAIKTITLAMTVYGIIIAADTDGITIILATLSIIAWIIQAIFEAVRFYIERKVKEFKASIAKDTAFISAPIKAVGGLVADVVGTVKEGVGEILQEGSQVLEHGAQAIELGAQAIGHGVESFNHAQNAVEDMKNFGSNFAKRFGEKRTNRKVLESSQKKMLDKPKEPVKK